MEKRVFYTGCLRHSGHYFWLNDWKSVLHEEDIMEAVPDFIQSWSQIWDGGLLKNSQTPDVYNGDVISIPAKGLWTAFCWWDRSVDTRGACNSGFYVYGFEWCDRNEAFKFAGTKWPEVIARQTVKLVLRD